MMSGRNSQCDLYGNFVSNYRAAMKTAPQATSSLTDSFAHSVRSSRPPSERSLSTSRSLATAREDLARGTKGAPPSEHILTSHSLTPEELRSSVLSFTAFTRTSRAVWLISISQYVQPDGARANSPQPTAGFEDVGYRARDERSESVGEGVACGVVTVGVGLKGAARSRLHGRLSDPSRRRHEVPTSRDVADDHASASGRGLSRSALLFRANPIIAHTPSRHTT